MKEPRVRMFDDPMTVTGFSTYDTPSWRGNPLFGGSCGDMVAVRPVNDRYGGRTYLGILMGEIAQTISVRITKEGLIQADPTMHNPAMFVPDLGEMIFGHSSWWGVIADESQLRDITDADVENVWYVKALRQIADRAKGEIEDEETSPL